MICPCSRYSSPLLVKWVSIWRWVVFLQDMIFCHSFTKLAYKTNKQIELSCFYEATGTLSGAGCRSPLLSALWVPRMKIILYYHPYVAWSTDFTIPSFLFSSQMTDCSLHLTVFCETSLHWCSKVELLKAIKEYCILIGNLCQFEMSKEQATLNWCTLGFDMLLQHMVQLELLERKTNSPYTY